MQTVLLVVQFILAFALVAAILLQRSEGGALGIGGGPGGMMSARGAADFLTKMTTWLAAGFILTSLGLTIVGRQASEERSVVDTVLEQQQSQEEGSASLPDIAPLTPPTESDDSEQEAPQPPTDR